MKCWICGAPGNSREHLIKASDVKLHFPGLNQKKPIYVHKRKKKNIPIGSRQSDHLKSNALICKKCNNERTQVYDFAWGKLSNYIIENWLKVERTNEINLEEVFSEDFEKSILNVHLYFLKLFGCALLEKLDIVSDNPESKLSEDAIAQNEIFKKNLSKEFASRILEEKSHNDVYLDFIKSKLHPFRMGISNLEVFNYKNELAGAEWSYCIGDLCIRIYYINPNHYDEVLKGWNPNIKSKIIKLI